MDEEAQIVNPQSLVSGPEPETDLASLLKQLDSRDRNTRLEAIDALSRIGDEAALEAMRERLRLVGREHQALIISIGTLRWRLSGVTESSLDQHG